MDTWIREKTKKKEEKKICLKSIHTWNGSHTDNHLISDHGRNHDLVLNTTYTLPCADIHFWIMDMVLSFRFTTLVFWNFKNMLDTFSFLGNIFSPKTQVKKTRYMKI